MLYAKRKNEEGSYVSVNTLMGSGNRSLTDFDDYGYRSYPNIDRFHFRQQTREISEPNPDPGDTVVEIARQYVGEIDEYDLGAKYDPDRDEYYKWVDSDGNGSLDEKQVYEEPTIDCSGFTHKIYNEAGYDLPHGSANQRNELGTQEQAVVGGLVYISPPAGGSISHIMIVSEVNEAGVPTSIIDSSAGNGVQERAWNNDWNDRNPQYLNVPW